MKTYSEDKNIKICKILRFQTELQHTKSVLQEADIKRQSYFNFIPLRNQIAITQNKRHRKQYILILNR